MDQRLALVAFSIVSTGSPRPNDVLRWAFGAAFGFRPTMPHIFGNVTRLPRNGFRAAPRPSGG